ncbi:hypothetical protein DBB42_14745 [Pseudomonas plecoglossicida]|uniref:Uncharacterized protein n=1 Tax=Pseudomonas plecoglossicida TaxID=70775 RepID=A0A2R7UGY6_PSEDL|nr:hypothetical protein DBB42_14745 [Pseudomonas plecoglossicida]
MVWHASAGTLTDRAFQITFCRPGLFAGKPAPTGTAHAVPVGAGLPAKRPVETIETTCRTLRAHTPTHPLR